MLSLGDYNAALPDFLPGRLILEHGSAGDYRTLAPFHYAAGAPATWAQVFVIRYLERGYGGVGEAGGRERNDSPFGFSRTVAVGVLSYPVPSCRPRERHFGRTRCSRDENLRFVNASLRTISRVIVHPQFRSLGLSTLLVRCLCRHCDTRYVEAIARMGRVHPLFERAGMLRTNLAHRDEPAYYILDRHPASQRIPGCKAA